MGQVKLSDIVNLPAFEEAGRLFHRATGMSLSFKDDSGQVFFYPAEERCDFCRLIQSTREGKSRCALSDKKAAERALEGRKPISYTCHAGLVDVVVPVVVGGERVGCFYSGQSSLTPPTTMGYQEIIPKIADLGLNPDDVWNAYMKVPLVDGRRLSVAMGLLSVICNHLVEGEIALRQERALTVEQKKLRRAAEESARLEHDLREMELRLLQAQLNPHFLFNTLNLIAGQAMMEDAPETAHLVQELSRLLRNSLSSIGKIVPLCEEVESARAYVEIFRARFERNVELILSLSENLKSVDVPALILQPVIENSLRYAGGSLLLKIRAEERDGCICISVEDNGPGIPEKRLAEITASLCSKDHKGKLTGLSGLNRRLKYYYPHVPDISIANLDPGLSVAIAIPLK